MSYFYIIYVLHSFFSVTENFEESPHLCASFFLVVDSFSRFHYTQCSNLWQGFWWAISWTGMLFSHIIYVY